MKLTPEYLASMAKLSRMELTEAEISAYFRELDEIFRYIDKLQEVDTQGVKPTAFAHKLQIICPED